MGSGIPAFQVFPHIKMSPGVIWSFSSSSLRFCKGEFLKRTIPPSCSSNGLFFRQLFISTSSAGNRFRQPEGKHDISPQNATPVDNQVLYRFKWMKHIRFISRVKILHVALMTSFTCPITYWYFCGDISLNSFICALTGAAGTTAGFVALSYFFRRIIGELSFHEATQQVTISSLTFWGNRRNRTFHLESLVPISDSGIDVKNLFHTLEVYGLKDSGKEVYLLNLRHCKIFDGKFFSVTGLPRDVISQVESAFSPKNATR